VVVFCPKSPRVGPQNPKVCCSARRTAPSSLSVTPAEATPHRLLCKLTGTTTVYPLNVSFYWGVRGASTKAARLVCNNELPHSSSPLTGGGAAAHTRRTRAVLEDGRGSDCSKSEAGFATVGCVSGCTWVASSAVLASVLPPCAKTTYNGLRFKGLVASVAAGKALESATQGAKHKAAVRRLARR